MISQLLSLKSARVLVVGDVMIDRYISGSTHRLSPEAPVPVVTPNDKWSIPGGAANVASNIAFLGAQVGLVCALSTDEGSVELKNVLDTNGVHLFGIHTTRSIPIKTRVRTDLQHIVRIDEEDSSPLNLDSEVLEIVSNLIETEIYNIVLVSDYAKGLISDSLLSTLNDFCRRHNVPVITDPKKDSHHVYNHMYLLKPNVKEAQDLVRSWDEIRTPADLSKLAHDVRQKTKAHNVIVTGGSLGCVLSDTDGEHYFPAPHQLHVRDVSGAGDTFISYIAAALSVGDSPSKATGLATLAASVSCSFVGTSPVSRSEVLLAIAESGISSSEKYIEDSLLDDITALLPRPIVFTNGCFDVLHPGHIESLEFARAQGMSLIVACNTDASVKKLKGQNRPLQEFESRVRTLCAISASTIVCALSEDDPESLIKRINPDVLIKGADYEGKTVVGQDHVLSRGGKVVFSPIISGFSTTAFEQKLNP